MLYIGKYIYQKLSSIRPCGPIKPFNSNPPMIFQLALVNHIWSFFSMLRNYIFYSKSRCGHLKRLNRVLTKHWHIINFIRLLIFCKPPKNSKLTISPHVAETKKPNPNPKFSYHHCDLQALLRQPLDTNSTLRALNSRSPSQHQHFNYQHPTTFTNFK